MANTLNLGNGNWGVKDSSLLGYKNRSNGRFLPETFDVSRGSAGTRVNQSGLIESPEEILSGELVTNGDFTTDSDWTINDWIISGGSLNGSASTGIVFQDNLGATIGKTYKVTLEISNYVSGSIRFKVGGSSYENIASSNGIQEFYFVAATSADNILFSVESVYTGSIDNVSVVEVNRDNLARIDYLDDAAGVLLTEPQSTNLVTDSNDFSDASWVKQGFGTATAPTVTSNFAISPDGNLNADRVIFDLNGGSTSDDFSQMNWVGSILNGDASASVYIKSNTNESYVMSFTTPSGSARQITVTPNWQRFSTFTLGISQSPTLRIRLRSGIESTSDYADVSIYGAQIEELSYPTSYIPTYGAVRTRLQDSVTGAGTVSDFNDSEGVLFVEISFLSKSNGTEQFKSISINDGSTSNIVTFESRSVENELKVIIRASGVQVMTSTQVLTDLTSMVKIAIKWKENDFSWWVNGVEVATDNIGLTPIGLSNLSLDGGGLGDFFGKTSQVQVFNTALSDFELQQLTTI